MDDVKPEGVPFEVLFESEAVLPLALPLALAETYGTLFGFRRPCVLANFVASVDGVVALAGQGESGAIVSQNCAADRFVMGLLRASADAVIVGAGTFRKSPGQLWNAGAIYPAGAAHFAELRSRLGLAPEPTFVLVTASGDVDPAEPALRNAIVITTKKGEDRLRAPTGVTARIAAFAPEGRIGMDGVISFLHREGLVTLLTEGGPSMMSELVKGSGIDELFMTVSPVLFGRYRNDERKSLTDGIDLGATPMDLRSVRRHGSHLFLRYAFAGRP